jgi:hypothetical protein
MKCPKCGADVSESLEEDDPSCGIVGGYYCDACDLPIPYEYEPHDDDVDVFFVDREWRDKIATDPDAAYARDRPLGTPISEISTRPGEPGYEEWIRISKSWGYD